MQKVLTSLAAVALSAVGAVNVASAAQPADLLVYQVWEQGVDPYVSRILVTPSHVRMDEGDGSSQYTLYDRKAQVIYNVDMEEQSILVIDPPAAELTTPADLQLGQQIHQDEGAPSIAGKTPQRVILTANGQVCRQLVAVPGLMPEAVSAMREFQKTLGDVQAATLSVMPAETQTPCDLAENVYAPLRRLDHGLPVQEDEHGRGRALLDFHGDFQADEALFELPADFRRSEMAALSASPR